MSRLLVRLGCCLCCISFAVSAWGANKPKPVPSGDPVQELLVAEMDSANPTVDRREHLQPTADGKKEASATLWQAGYVFEGKQWRAFEETVAAGEEADRLDAYRQQRALLASQAHGKWALAQWCRKNGLHDQERVHLLQAIADGDAGPNPELAYQRLGCQRAGTGWVSLQERQDAARLATDIEKSHKLWDRKLKAIAELLAGSPKQRAAAEKQLDELSHQSAVHAIVDTFSLSGPLEAEFSIKALGQIPQFQASRALAGQAVFSPWKPVRAQATELLKQRKLTDFVPDLLLLLSKPILTKTQVTHQVDVEKLAKKLPETDVRMNWDYVWIDEREDTIRVGIRRLFPLSVPAHTTQVVSNLFPNKRALYDRATGQRLPELDDNLRSMMAFLELVEQSETLDRAAEYQNDWRGDVNTRVGRVLSKCTDEPMSDDPQKWWDFWTNFSSVSAADKKVVVVDQRRYQPDAPSVSRQVVRMSCLVAGTPIWTERGFVSIEQIQPGDRVLAKEIESGELAYKPVLQTTSREPTPVHRFRVGDEVISASLGHHFWISGEGWTKTRDLRPEHSMHTATGMHRISQVTDEGEVEKVYNLVVADFHTYFVGKSMVLSHDVTAPQLSNAKVPGLVDRNE